MEILNYYPILKKRLQEKTNVAFIPSEMTRFIRNLFDESDIIFKTIRNCNAMLDGAIVSGQYDPYSDKENFASINIYINYHPDQKIIQFSDFDSDCFLIELCDTIMHEQCHQNQYRKRKYKPPKIYKSLSDDRAKRNEEEYLGKCDEIEAYGCSIATEIFLKFDLTIPHLLDNELSEVRIFNMYCDTFGTTHKIVKELQKFVHLYLTQFNQQFSKNSNANLKN